MRILLVFFLVIYFGSVKSQSGNSISKVAIGLDTINTSVADTSNYISLSRSEKQPKSTNPIGGVQLIDNSSKIKVDSNKKGEKK